MELFFADTVRKSTHFGRYCRRVRHFVVRLDDCFGWLFGGGVYSRLLVLRVSQNRASFVDQTFIPEAVCQLGKICNCAEGKAPKKDCTAAVEVNIDVLPAGPGPVADRELDRSICLNRVWK